jgi:hypothetical protein
MKLNIVPTAAQVVSEGDRALAMAAAETSISSAFRGESIITEADRAAAAAAAITNSKIIWYDLTDIGRGVVLWAIPEAGWVKTFHRGDRLAVLPCRQDGSPVTMASLNEIEVGWARPTLDQHWLALRACLVSR